MYHVDTPIKLGISRYTGHHTETDCSTVVGITQGLLTNKVGFLDIFDTKAARQGDRKLGYIDIILDNVAIFPFYIVF